MAEEFLITITGLEDVQRMLAEAPKHIVATGFLKALQAGANVIKAAVDVRTPVETGDLKAALMSQVTLDSQYRGGQAQVGFGKKGRVANYIEYGHRIVAHGATWADRLAGYEGKLLGEVKPSPFMRQAVAASADAAIQAFGETLAGVLKGEYGE